MTNPTKQWQDEADREYPKLPYSSAMNMMAYSEYIKTESEMDGLRFAFLKGCEFEHGRDKWISVNNELPKDRGYYLVYSSKTDDSCPVRVALFCRVNMGSHFITVDRYEVITHWQPITLPTAPKSKI